MDGKRIAVARRWPLLALLLLMPFWILGVSGRGLWTPDEPREYDIAFNMLRSGDLVVPQLAGVPFVEKPPLAYWAQSASMRVFGASIAAARLPNVLWAALAVLSIGALAGDAAGVRDRHRAALIAAMACGTLVLVLQVQIWLATDAPLLGLTGLALLSGWRLVRADTRRQQLLWSLLFGASLAGAVLAKNGFGLLVPVLTLVTWLAWERRLRELLRWPIWMAAGVCALMVGAWLLALARRPGGYELLRVLVWDNVAGRFLPMESAAALELGHKSSHWRFLLLLPAYLLPWTFAVVGAGRWSMEAARSGAESASAVRYCIAMVVPACIVLLISRTARGIYFAPALLGVPVLLALWYVARSAAFSTFEQTTLRLTRYTLRALAILLAVAAALLMVLAGIHSIAAFAAVAMFALVLVGLAWSLRARAVATHGIAAATGLFLAALAALQLVAFPILDRSEDLTSLIKTAEPQLRKEGVVSYCADETTRAALDYIVDLRPPDVCTVEDARQLLNTHRDQQFLVLLAPPPTAQRLRELFPDADLPALKRKPARITPAVADLVGLGLRPTVCWSSPGGRKYSLYGRASSNGA